MASYFDGLQFQNHGHVSTCAGGPCDWTTPYYCLAFVAGGALRWKIEGKRVLSLRAPTAWWFGPGMKITFGPEEGQTWDHYYVTFSGPRADRMFQQGLVPRQIQLHRIVAHPERFRELFESLLALLDDQPQKQSFLVHGLESLWMELHRPVLCREETHSSAAKMKRLIQAIRITPQQEWEMSGEAQKLHFSEVHFRHLFRQQCGLPPHQWVLHCRLALAARLLREGTLPVKKIAEEAGFPDPFHFTKMFRRHYGIPPAAYRREIQSQIFGA